MFTIYWGNRLIGTYPQNKEILFKEFCKQKNITYQYCNDKGDYLLFPVLKGINIALCPLDNFIAETELVLKNISEKLIPWGALAVYIRNKKRFMKLIQILKVQILVSVTNNTDIIGEKGIRFFYSLKKKEESLAVIASVTEHLINNKLDISYEVSGGYDFLLKLNYLQYYMAAVPTVLMEINGFDAAELEKFENAVTDGLIDIYGNMNIEEQLLNVKDLLSHLEQTCETNSAGPEEIEKEAQEEVPEEVAEEAPEEVHEEENNQLSMPADTEKIKRTKHGTPAVKKNKTNHVRTKTALFPPEDSPVYQFTHTNNTAIFNRTASAFMNRNEKNTFSSFNNISKDLYKNNLTDTEFIGQTKQSYNIFEELKDISRKITPGSENFK